MALVEFEDGKGWLAGRRCHHGALGLALALLGACLPGAPGRWVRDLGLALAVHDLADAPWLPSRRPA